MGLFGLLVGAVAAVAGDFWLNRETNDSDQKNRYVTYRYDNYDYGRGNYYDSYPKNVKVERFIQENKQKETQVYSVPEKKKTLRLIEKLDVYRPNDQLLDFNNPITIEKLRYQLLSIKDFENYLVKFFELLLQVEDVEELSAYLPFVQQNVLLKKTDQKNYEVQLNKNATTISMKDTVTAYCDEVVVIPYNLLRRENINKYLVPGNDGIYSKNVAIITDEIRSKLKFSFDKPVEQLKDLPRVDLIVRPRRELYRYQRRALMLLSNNVAMKRYLLPGYVTHKLPSLQINLINKDLRKNSEQILAVNNILAGAGGSAPFIVFGPPGTGKTSTIVESILQLRLRYPERRILVTAGSNSACDTIAMKLCEYFDKKALSTFSMLRIYSKGMLHKLGINHIPQSLKNRSNLTWNEGKPAYPAVEDINKYGIIIATLCTIGKYELARFAHSKGFEYVFIDEAGAASEPESLIGIMAVNPNGFKICRVILSGDHKQLGPVLKSSMASELGLGISLMERLLNCKCYEVEKSGKYDTNLQIRLRRNYRSHPEIVKLYNHLYYENDLIAMCSKAESSTTKSKWSFLPKPSSAIGFQAVYGECIKGSSKSWSNKLEVEVMMAYIQLLLKVDGVSQSEIGFITPYRLQCELIEKNLKAKNWHDIEIGSVENFQGREKTIIIASMVRSNQNLGFVKCVRRWNVLISRPKALLLVMGNPATLSKFEDINFVIEECKRAGNYMGKSKYQKLLSTKVEFENSWNKQNQKPKKPNKSKENSLKPK